MNFCILQTLYFDKVDISEGIGVYKISVSKECDIRYYLYFLNHSSKFQPNVCNRCHDLDVMMSMDLSNIAILKAKSCVYRCVISLIIKMETISVMQIADLTEKSGKL